MNKKYLGQANILVEGIDGSGKDEFVRMLSESLKNRFSYHPLHTLAIVGQPAFCYDHNDKVRAIIERGETVVDYENAIEMLTNNRQLHEKYLKSFGGVVVCLRGVLTELATLSLIYKTSSFSDLGQSRIIDIAILIDADVQNAYARICSRNRLPDWRETPEKLEYFRHWYLTNTNFNFIRKFITFNNNGTLADLKKFAEEIVSLLEKMWVKQ